MLARRLDFDVVARHRRRVDDDVRALDVLGAMADEDLRPERRQPLAGARAGGKPQRLERRGGPPKAPPPRECTEERSGVPPRAGKRVWPASRGPLARGARRCRTQATTG